MFIFSFYAIPEDYQLHYADWVRLPNDDEATKTVAKLWRKNATKVGAGTALANASAQDFGIAVETVTFSPQVRFVLVRLPEPPAAPFPYFIAVPLFGSGKKVWFLERSRFVGTAIVGAVSPNAHSIDAQTKHRDPEAFLEIVRARMAGESLVHTTHGQVIMEQGRAWGDENHLARRRMGLPVGNP